MVQHLYDSVSSMPFYIQLITTNHVVKYVQSLSNVTLSGNEIGVKWMGALDEKPFQVNIENMHFLTFYSCLELQRSRSSSVDEISHF